MRILLVTADYPPEVRSIAAMARELAEYCVAHGHTVTVLTTWPRYTLPRDSDLASFLPVMDEGSVRVIRTDTLPLHGGAYWIRGIAQLTLPWFLWRAWKRWGNGAVDAVVLYSPPLPIAEFGARVKRGAGARMVLNVQDIFPQNAVDLGILHNRLLRRFFEWIERRAYTAADAVTTHTAGGRDFLVRIKGVPEAKVSVVQNWIDCAPYTAAERTGRFRARWNLGDRFIILFPGILGPAQNLSYVIDVAKRLADCPEILFLFVGDGTAKPMLQERVRADGLSSVRFEGFIAPAEYPALLKDVDMGLLSLGADNTTATVPGKLLGFMAAGLPIVAFLNRESDGHAMIADAGCGVSLVPDDPDAGARCIRTLVQRRAELRAMGDRGPAYALAHFAKSSCLDMMERIVTNTLPHTIAIEPIASVGADPRGPTWEWKFSDGHQLTMHIRRKGAHFAHHYHTGRDPSKNPERFFLVQGSVRVTWTDADGRTNVRDVAKGSALTIPAMIPHCFDALEDCTLVEYRTTHFDRNDADVVPLSPH